MKITYNILARHYFYFKGRIFKNNKNAQTRFRIEQQNKNIDLEALKKARDKYLKDTETALNGAIKDMINNREVIRTERVVGE